MMLGGSYFVQLYLTGLQIWGGVALCEHYKSLLAILTVCTCMCVCPHACVGVCGCEVCTIYMYSCTHVHKICYEYLPSSLTKYTLWEVIVPVPNSFGKEYLSIPA